MNSLNPQSGLTAPARRPSRLSVIGQAVTGGGTNWSNGSSNQQHPYGGYNNNNNSNPGPSPLSSSSTDLPSAVQEKYQQQPGGIPRYSNGNLGGTLSGIGSGVAPLSTHRVPLHLRIPGLFRTRIPLIAVIPFFLLGYLFAPVQRFDPSEQQQQHASVSSSTSTGAKPAIGSADVAGNTASQNRLLSYQQGKEWAQRFMYPAGQRTPHGSSSVHLDPVEHFTDKDGLLYYHPAAPEDVIEGVEVAYSHIPPQRHPILHLIEKGG
jgi:hypothetical protein